VLSRTPTEIVVGGCGSPWKLRGAMGPFSEPRPGTVLIACDFRAEPVGDGTSVLSTETRIRAVDDFARGRFGWYLRFVRPGSALIRRAWLRAAAKRLRR
jgi:hypothetical protein